MNRLVVVAPNWLGDAVMALPAIADLRRARPDASIAVAARPSLAALFTLVRDVDEVAAFAEGGPSPLAGRDAALLLPNSFHAAFCAWRAGVPERWGYATDCRGFLLTRSVPRPASPPHQGDSYQALVRALGFPSGPAAPRIDVTAAVCGAGAAALRQAGWDGRAPIVALAPGAAYGSAKRWPPRAFAGLAAALAGDGVVTAMVGAGADRATAREVTRAAGGRAMLLDLVGRTDVPTLAGVLAGCRTLVANDSGAAHLAAAVGVSVTTLFGPTDERLSAPRSRRDIDRDMNGDMNGDGHMGTDQGPAVSLLTHPTWCRPCMLRECPLDHGCMNGIEVPRVLDEARRRL